VKRVAAIVKPSDIASVKETLARQGARAVFTIAEVHGFGSRSALPHQGRKHELPHVTEAKVETVISDEAADLIVPILRKIAKSDEKGEPRVFLLTMEDGTG